jgi:hypothetical protein
MKNYTCKQCGTSVLGRGAMRQHYAEFHPDYISPAKAKKQLQQVAGQSVMDKILTAEATMRDAVKDLEFERLTISNRLRELDDMIAKYKKLI